MTWEWTNRAIIFSFIYGSMAFAFLFAVWMYDFYHTGMGASFHWATAGPVFQIAWAFLVSSITAVIIIPVFGFTIDAAAGNVEVDVDG